jgi:hypothetical protein
MDRRMFWYLVTTDCGKRKTLAVSAKKAERNVRYRLVMDSRNYSRATPKDFAQMRDIEIISIERLRA